MNLQKMWWELSRNIQKMLFNSCLGRHLSILILEYPSFISDGRGENGKREEIGAKSVDFRIMVSTANSQPLMYYYIFNQITASL